MIPKSGNRFPEKIMRQAKMSAITQITPQLIATVTLRVDTPGAGFTDITSQAANFIAQIGAGEGTLLIFLRHTSASLVIQENADPDVQTDLVSALDRLAPEDAPWIHDVEGPDDMPAHVKAMLNGVSLHVPVIAGKFALGNLAGHLSGRAPAGAAQPRNRAAIRR
jgi:secondary thiamine-phosphate synthase enzyme